MCTCSVAVFISAEFARSQQTAVHVHVYVHSSSTHVHASRYTWILCICIKDRCVHASCTHGSCVHCTCITVHVHMGLVGMYMTMVHMCTYIHSTHDCTCIMVHMDLVYMYRTLAKVRPWALHLTFSPNRGVGALSSVSAFNLERAPTFVYVNK